MRQDSYSLLYARLAEKIPAERLIRDPLRTLAYGTDASFYRLIPRLIVRVETEPEVLLTLSTCREMNLPVTFRAAGTSLSGQAVTDSVLVLLGVTGWRQWSVAPDGSEIRLGAAVLGIDANRYLAPFGRKIGPDPASINSAKIGGIVSNNACGMTSGVTQNSQGTLKTMRIIFADGTLLDTGDPENRNRFLNTRPNMVDRIQALADRIKADPRLFAKIREKYTIKNTCGYSLNALTDYDDPIEIIQHLMVGSEGTLGFISEVTFRTTREAPHTATALMLFPTIASACEAVLLLKKYPVSAAELMDRTALATVADKPSMPPHIKKLGPEATALLVETRAENTKELNRQIEEITEAFASFPMAHEFAFTTDPEAEANLWQVRKGIFPSACSMRNTGTTVIIEDIAVPIHHLENTIVDLQALFAEFGYENTVIWGHVFDGNVHFVLTPDFSDAGEVDRYRRFMDAVAELVVDRYNGSLKAEHGTGRNMAPFVEREWGSELYEAMREIKNIFDPQGMLNPGVIINEDPECHLQHFKPMPAAHPEVDECTECGFCERNCMSHEFTLSARQRIVIYREMAHLARTGENPTRLAELRRIYDYYGDTTCAADGLCATSCPVDIDTGKLIKHLRSENLSAPGHALADAVGHHMTGVTALTRLGLNIVDKIHGIIGTPAMTRLSLKARRISKGLLPLWTPYMPQNAAAVSCMPARPDHRPKAVYFPSCITRTMGPSRLDEEAVSLTRKTESLLDKAGYDTLYPKNMDGLCCGMPFSSKGIADVAEKKARELEAALMSISDNGDIPILCDMSPCLHHMKETLDPRLKLFEPIEFTLTHLAPRLTFTKIPEAVAIHTVCSAKKMGLEGKLKQLAEMCAEKVVTPEVTCCGFAGDRGFTHPELNAFGLRHLNEQIPDHCRNGYSTSRTCEIGLSHHGGIPYQSILYLVDRCTEPKR